MGIVCAKPKDKYWHPTLETTSTMSGITDLESCVTQWAKRQAKKLGIGGADKASVTVNWNRVKFIPSDPHWTMDGQVPLPPNVTIYSSTFHNNSDSETEHTLKMERATRATCKTTISKGCTTGIDLSLSLALPNEVASATVGFGREIRVDTSDETTKEQEQLWSVDTKVTARPYSRTKVRVDVKETRHKGTFRLPVTVKGMLIVNFYDQNTPGNHLGLVEGNVAEIFPSNFERSPSGGVEMSLEGKADFIFGVKQNVVVEEEVEAI